MSACNEAVPPGYAFTTITVPTIANSNTKVLRICIGPGLLQLDFPTGGEPQGMPIGATPLQTAILLADAINNRNTASLNAARATYDMSATQSGNVVTIMLAAPPAWCDAAVKVVHYSLAAFAAGDCVTPYIDYSFPFLNAATNLACCPEPAGDELICANYPPNSYVERVQFENVGGVQTFGAGAIVGRVQVGPVNFPRSVFPFWAWVSDPRAFDWLMYSTFDEWMQGFVDYYNTLGNGWFFEVRYLGGGVVDFVMDTAHPDIMNLPVSVTGLIIGTVRVGAVASDPIQFEKIGRLQCFEPDVPIVVDPPVPPEEPDFTPPEVPPTPDYIPPVCREFFDFECCDYTAGGVRRVLAIPRELFTGYTLGSEDEVTGVITSIPVWYEFCLQDAVTVMNVAEDKGDAGVRFIVSLAAATVYMSQQNRNVLESLRRRRLTLIIEDRNGRYWLIGEDGAARVENITGTTGAARTESNQYTFTFRAFTRWLPRTVSADVVENLQIGAIDCQAYVGLPIGDVPMAVLLNCYVNDLEDNYFYI